MGACRLCTRHPYLNLERQLTSDRAARSEPHWYRTVATMTHVKIASRRLVVLALACAFRNRFAAS